MKALSLRQPHATLTAIGAKTIETRSWGTQYRGLFAIHAAKGWTWAERELLQYEPFYSVLADHFGDRWFEVGDLDSWVRETWLPLGAVIATANLVDCRRIAWDVYPRLAFLDARTLSKQEVAFGNYETGRYAWVLADVKLLPEPIPAKGALGLWEWKSA